MNKVYSVAYLADGIYSKTKYVTVLARNKAEAYRKGTYEVIPQETGYVPYASWVSSVTFSNGNYKQFDTFAGKPY